jgi:hypothetical protein
MISRKPITKLSAVIVQNTQGDWSVRKYPIRPRMPASVARLMTCRPGSMIGDPDILPFSFRNAMTEPEKVIAPIAMPRPISIRLTAKI